MKQISREDLLDPNRLNRVHVVNGRLKDGHATLILSDRSIMTWEEWINGGREELRNVKRFS